MLSPLFVNFFFRVLLYHFLDILSTILEKPFFNIKNGAPCGCAVLFFFYAFFVNVMVAVSSVKPSTTKV